jgi:hypothetical protein
MPDKVLMKGLWLANASETRLQNLVSRRLWRSAPCLSALHTSIEDRGGNHLSQISYVANRRIGNMNEPVIFRESDALCAMLALRVEDASYKAAQPDSMTFD